MITNLSVGKPAKVLFLFTLPMLLGNVFQQLYNISDSIIVGNYVGEDALAAVGSTFVLVFLTIGIAIGSSTGSSIVISQAFGSGDMKKVRSGITTALISVTLLGFVISASGLFLLKPLLELLNTPAENFSAAYGYILIIFFGCPFMFLYNCLTAVFNALGDSKTPLKFLIFSTLTNIGLDLLFVINFNMETKGVGYATIIAQGLSAIGLLLFFLYKINRMNLGEKGKLFDFKILKEMTSYAIPSVIQQSIVATGMMAVQGLVNSYGQEMMAGYAAATKIDSIAVMPMLNISTALSTYSAQNLGAKKLERIKQGHFAALKLILFFAIMTSIVVAFFGEAFVNLFMDSEVSKEAIRLGTEYLKIVSVFYFLMGIMFAANGVLRGIGFMKLFMLTTLINLI
ncbi:MAG: MATE family efflux transporter, partial [Oscillospiraceae bacterium]